VCCLLLPYVLFLHVSRLYPKLTLTIAEAVDYSGVGRSVIEGAINAGKLKASKVGHRGARVIKRADLEAWVKKL
jgi:excisionase family DNA binding protein